jgi:dethiobiotin synthase
LHAALGGTLNLDEINPWHFRAPVTPSLAARLEKKSVTLQNVLTHVRALEKPFTMTLVEGAGGLLSPLGVGFDSRDLLTALRATPFIVAPNRLGAINHVRLTCEAFPAGCGHPHKCQLAKIPGAAEFHLPIAVVWQQL